MIMATTQNIDSILHEQRTFEPPHEFTAEARLNPQRLAALHARAEADHEAFWAEIARTEISWHRPFHITLDADRAPHFRWFADGQLNVSYNCLDRRLDDKGDKTAILFEGEKGDIRTLTYRDLHKQVCRFANALLGLGIRSGDRVVIYMPMIPEAAIAMLGCARIGAIHSVVFGGFSADP